MSLADEVAALAARVGQVVGQSRGVPSLITGTGEITLRRDRRWVSLAGTVAGSLTSPLILDTDLGPLLPGGRPVTALSVGGWCDNSDVGSVELYAVLRSPTSAAVIYQGPWPGGNADPTVPVIRRTTSTAVLAEASYFFLFARQTGARRRLRDRRFNLSWTLESGPTRPPARRDA